MGAGGGEGQIGPLSIGERLIARAWASTRAVDALVRVTDTIARALPMNPSDGGGSFSKRTEGWHRGPTLGDWQAPCGCTLAPPPYCSSITPPKEFKRFFSYTSSRRTHFWNRDTFFLSPEGWPGQAPRQA